MIERKPIPQELESRKTDLARAHKFLNDCGIEVNAVICFDLAAQLMADYAQFCAQMELAHKVMTNRREVLRKLAEQF